MREYFTKEDTILFAKALSLPLRLDMLHYVFKNKGCSLNDLADVFKVSRAAVTQHMKLLTEADLIEVRAIKGSKEARKACFVKEDKFIISLGNQFSMDNIYEAEIPIGQYIGYDVTPTCGIATAEQLIGKEDNACFFDDPQRMNAGILWFNTGFIEYRLPNYLEPGRRPAELQLIMEISSEAPGVAENWPSDISFYFNDILLGQWTSPGDFGETRRGIYTPEWWCPNWNQYGLLKLLSVNNKGSFIDGRQISGVTINDLQFVSGSQMLFRIGVSEKAEHVGGFTIFGRGFGNYNQDIKFRVIYE